MTASITDISGRNVVWEPQPKQRLFLSCPIKEVLYGGRAGGGKALTPDHEVLTEDGWKLIGDVTVGQRVLAWDQEVEHGPGKLTYATVRGVYEQADATKLVEHENRPYFRASADHRWLVTWETSRKKQEKVRWKVVRSVDLGSNIKIPASGVPAALTRVDYSPAVMELWGWYLSEGCPHVNGVWSRLSQSKPEGKDAIRDVLTRAGVAFREYEREFVAEWAPPLPCGLSCYDKFIPRPLFAQAALASLVEGLIGGDGFRRRKGWEYYSASKQLADGVQEAAILLGLRATVVSKKTNYVSKRSAPTKGGKGSVRDAANWRVSAYPHLAWTLSPGKLKWKPYSGKTYCLWVPGPGTFFARYKGTAFVTGNSDALIMKPIFRQLAPAHAAYVATGAKSRGRALVIRKSYNRLKDIIARCHGMFPIIDPGVRYNSTEHMFHFSCGYRYELGHLESIGDEENYQGQEFSQVCIDEAQEVPFDQMMFLKSRLRTTDPVLTGLLSLDFTANPGGPHGAWVKERFVTPHRAGMKVLTQTISLPGGRSTTSERIFIPAGYQDNKYLGDDYEALLSSLPSHLVRMLRDGDWDVVVGAFFSDVWDPTVHVCKKFTIPETWHKFRSGDYGYAAPSSIGWWAVDHDGNLIRFKELYIKKHTAEMLAHRIREIEQDLGLWDDMSGSKITGPLDPACWSKGGVVGMHGPSIAETMISLGVRWFRGDNNRIIGWNEVRRRMMARSGPDGRTPALRFFEGECRESIVNVPAVIFDANNPEDVDTGCNDHQADDLRYSCMSRPYIPEKPKYNEDEEDELSYARRARRGGRYGYG